MKHVPEHEQLRSERSGLSPGVFASIPQGFIGNLRQGQLPLKPP